MVEAALTEAGADSMAVVVHSTVEAVAFMVAARPAVSEVPAAGHSAVRVEGIPRAVLAAREDSAVDRTAAA